MSDPIFEELQKLAQMYGVSDPADKRGSLLGRIAAIEAVLLSLPQVTPRVIRDARRRIVNVADRHCAEAALEDLAMLASQRD